MLLLQIVSTYFLQQSKVTWFSNVSTGGGGGGEVR